MFGNFIYFILVLLIYSTYQPSEEVGLGLGESLLLFAVLALAFAAFTQLVFRRIERRIGRMPFEVLDQMYQAALLRSSAPAATPRGRPRYRKSAPRRSTSSAPRATPSRRSWNGRSRW